jgi:hypothetical protein
MTSDPYADMARVVPYTVNWQVKQRLGGKEGSTPMDLKKLIRLIKAGGYRGGWGLQRAFQAGFLLPVGLMLLAVAMGVLDQLVEQERLDKALTLAGSLVGIVLIAIWCQYDSCERSYTIPKPMRLLVIFIAILGIPIYLLRTRGLRGVVSIVLAVAFFGVCVLFAALASEITYRVECLIRQ